MRLALLGIATLAATMLASCGAIGPMTGASPGAMSDMPTGVRNIPPVKGFADGQEIYFIHTEASDPQVADMLTKMMGSPVLVVPTLARIPEALLATVYVFKNGVKGGGPFGFQPDVFVSTPGRTGYSPLRALHLVTWKDAPQARVLRSADEVAAAASTGELAIERSGVVVNMPMIRWPGGGR